MVWRTDKVNKRMIDLIGSMYALVKVLASLVLVISPIGCFAFGCKGLLITLGGFESYTRGLEGTKDALRTGLLYAIVGFSLASILVLTVWIPLYNSGMNFSK
jgi:hypothetical protein